MTSLPQSAEELLDRLFAIFPQYQAQYSGPIHDDTPSYHSVLIGFSSEFGGLSTSSDEQLHAFADLVNEAVGRGGELENAFSTCVLEHLHQISARKQLWPYLSDAARERTKP